ncbi:MAG TPA: 4'-phosphopantetheinyl transferase superfamily protein [Herpetosiphonaceae bacterium]
MLYAGTQAAPNLADLVTEGRFVAVALRTPSELDAPTIERLCAALSDDERIRYGRFEQAAKRVEFLLSRVLARRVLGAILGVAPAAIRWITTPAGKPLLADDHGLAFNFSHAQGYLLCGVSRYGAIGVDVERLGEYKAAIARRFFAHDEWQWLESLDPQQQARGFYHLWTVKEACIKALGAGLRFPLRKLPVADADVGTSLGLPWHTLPVDPLARAAVALRLADPARAPDAGTLLHVDLAWLLRGRQPGIKEIKVS